MGGGRVLRCLPRILCLGGDGHLDVPRAVGIHNAAIAGEKPETLLPRFEAVVDQLLEEDTGTRPDLLPIELRVIGQELRVTGDHEHPSVNLVAMERDDPLRFDDDQNLLVLALLRILTEGVDLDSGEFGMPQGTHFRRLAHTILLS